MSHPGPLLTDFVDGTLGGSDLGDVEAHLARCATCREEVALARAARSSLASLPAAAPPPGLADAAIAQAAAGPTPTDITARSSDRPARRWIAIAAAAAVIALVALAFPKLGTSPSQTAASSAGGSADRSFATASAVEVVEANLSSKQLAMSAIALGGVQEAAAEAASSGDPSGAPTVELPDLQPTQRLPERLPEASACLDQAWGATPGQLTRMVLARFQGIPAYFGLYAVGPGAGLPPTRLQLLVASVNGCEALASAYALL